MDYKPGDFSFIQKYKEVFEYDYKTVNKLGEIAWNALANENPPTYIIDIINCQLYPGHIALSYRLSMNNLIFIAKNGWDKFVIQSV